MTAAELIDLAPVLELLALGAALAVLPLTAVVWKARRDGVHGWPAWQRVLTAATLFLTLDLVAFGAFTRLTDSGLGCPDWPGCYGEASPWGAREDIHAAHQAAPHGPVSPGKAWIEMVHRYLASGVGALITLLMVMAWRHRRTQGGLSPWWATITFVWVCVQGAFGALTVTMKLQPLIVSIHLLGALLGVGLLTAQARVLEGYRPQRAHHAAQEGVWRAWQGAGLRRWGWVVLALLGLQVALGGWVSTNYAVLACMDVPTCQGRWWPEMDFVSGFRLWRPLGQDGHGEAISAAALTAIHMAHRLMALVVVGALLAYAWRLLRWRPAGAATPMASTPWRREAQVLLAMTVVQVLTGLSNVVLGWPLLAALLHTMGAALLVWWLVRLLVVPVAVPQMATAPQGSRPVTQGLHRTA